MSALARRAAGLAFRKGMGGGGRSWLVLGACVWVAARAREKAKGRPVLLRQVLAPGESIRISVGPPAP